MKKNNPNASVVQIARHQGNLWRNMSPKERAPFEAMARKDLRRYWSAMKKKGGRK